MKTKKKTKQPIGNKQRQKCEVYSRIVGYIRPIDNWNAGKQAEFKDRKNYDNTITTACNCS